MLKQKHQYQESSRQTRVKMHKSGKNWVRTVVSNIGLLRFFKGLATQDIKVQALEDDIQKHSHAVSLLRGIATTGAMLGGSLVLADHVMAEEVTGATERPLTMTDTVTMDTVTVTETSPSTTETVKDNQERSSLSSSESQSQSLSNSESASASQVALASETATPSLLQPRAMVSASNPRIF
ncbi:accessory Sec-dependent serine-rich glycoprotein adhesin [Streptococcus iniae]|uniref:accessory Sec-dependent serine-rich glycoprotein adhesin n=1 Tax=Streptococcus iniae TaxID=1346 RepID=UPI002B28A788|nr:accessory Sec-dependent serine-rich glycoprotein adhesin [Streptococcus iniae]WNZ93155.1 accessory Sec-dependent serine-rich glycoprotein adhesin [Streptococcus iniae]WNZ94383.1 accessory Sec-dependent serine-rich glycoprotein adhesin [Streptococcus iniae]WNZ96146.1 accessory Sec-dependent serine-rich glycoprotein adhesin [Streptococcus iniae]WNZ97348.1 accessory Sec-dependent serine-rich glycoprotein adhesin [Streptococcus iniae]